jgi:hypothetical protein
VEKIVLNLGYGDEHKLDALIEAASTITGFNAGTESVSLSKLDEMLSGKQSSINLGNSDGY